MSAHAAEGRIYGHLFHESRGLFLHSPSLGGEAEFNISVQVEMGLLSLDVAYQDLLQKRITHLLQSIDEAHLDLCLKIQPAENLI